MLLTTWTEAPVSSMHFVTTLLLEMDKAQSPQSTDFASSPEL